MNDLSVQKINVNRENTNKIEIKGSTSSLISRIKHWILNDFLKFFVSLTYTKIRISLPCSKWRYYDEIQGLKQGVLFLGAIPLKNNVSEIASKMQEAVKTRGNRDEQEKNIIEEIAFLSVVEPHETLAGLIYKPALTPPLWTGKAVHEQSEEKVNRVNLHVPAPDFGVVPLEIIQKGVEFIEGRFEKGEPVYVHCKAGRSRSATIVAAYLLKNEWAIIEKHGIDKGKKPVDDSCWEDKLEWAIEYLKDYRTQVDIGKNKKANICAYMRQLS